MLDKVCSGQQTIILKWMWIGLFLVLAIDTVWMSAAGFYFAWRTIPPMYAIVTLGCLLISLLCAIRYPDPSVFMFTQSMALVVFGFHSLGMLGYLGTSLAMPLADQALYKMDIVLGFDGIGYLLWVNHHALVRNILMIAYAAQTFESFCVLIILALAKRPLDMHRFMLALLISVVITTLMASAWPAMGIDFFYNNGHASPFDPSLGRVLEHKDFMALRDGSLRQFTVTMQGVMSFPSFHTTAALLLIWVTLRLRWFGLLGIMLNSAIILATPVYGGHYLVDVIGGALVAFAAILSANILLPRPAEMAVTKAIAAET